MSDHDEARGRARLRRDSQQWAFDHAVAETGRVFHWQQPGRGRLPASVKMHAMISTHVGKTAQRSERLAEAEADAGHELTALGFYYDAAVKYASAQHTVFALGDTARDGLVQAPAELWVYADQHHSVNLRGSNAVQWHGDHHATTADWLRDRMRGAPVRYPGQTLYLEPNGVSPNDPSVPRRPPWFDGGRG